MSDSAKVGICQANLEQLELERIELGWMRMNSPPCCEDSGYPQARRGLLGL